MPFRVGPMEMIILLLVVMMIFGLGRLPQVGNVLGKTFRDFRKVQEDADAGVAHLSFLGHWSSFYGGGAS